MNKGTVKWFNAEKGYIGINGSLRIGKCLCMVTFSAVTCSVLRLMQRCRNIFNSFHFQRCFSMFAASVMSHLSYLRTPIKIGKKIAPSLL